MVMIFQRYDKQADIFASRSENACHVGN